MSMWARRSCCISEVNISEYSISELGGSEHIMSELGRSERSAKVSKL